MLVLVMFVGLGLDVGPDHGVDAGTAGPDRSTRGAFRGRCRGARRGARAVEPRRTMSPVGTTPSWSAGDEAGDEVVVSVRVGDHVATARATDGP